MTPHCYAFYTIVCVLATMAMKRCLLLGSFLPAAAPPPHGGDSSAGFKDSDASFTSSSSSREMIGKWMGKTWIPPRPWRYFDAGELREMYKDKNVLWIGDSTGRRAFATMYAILDEKAHHVSSSAMSDPAVIDVNKHGKHAESCNKNFTNVPADRHPNLCRPAPGGGNGEFSYIVGTCFHSVELVLQSELDGTTNMTADVDVIILSLGIWEVVERKTCNMVDVVKQEQQGHERTPVERLDHALDLAARFTAKTGKLIVWRTSGYGGYRFTIKGVDMYNRTMNAIDHNLATTNNSNLLYVNWGDAVGPRSFGPDKLAGDIPAHYSEEARVVLVQMITNRLHEIGFFEVIGKPKR